LTTGPSINAAYRAAARQAHPDRNRNNADANGQMAALTNAKDILLAHVKKEALITSPEIQTAVQEGLFDAAALRNIHEMDKLECLLHPQYVQAFRDNYFSFSDVVNMNADMLQAILDFQGIQHIRDGRFTFDRMIQFQTPEMLSRHIISRKLVHSRFNDSFNIFSNRHHDASETFETTRNKAVIRELYNTLNSAKRNFLNSDTIQTAQATFIEACQQAINTAIPELEENSAWKPILLDILNALVALSTLGIANMVYGTFRLFKAPAPGLDDEIQNVMTSLENLDSAPNYH
jgi:curved DNA-binding protein CbpA